MRSNMTMWMLMLGLVLPEIARADRIEVRLQVPRPRLEVDDAGTTRVRIDGYENPAAPGRPALPARAVYVLVPAGHRVVSVTSTPGSLVPLAGEHLVAPGQKQYPQSYRGPRPVTPPDPVVYASHQAIPPAFADGLEVQSLHGYELVPIRVYPVRYTPAVGKLVYAPSLSVTVRTALQRDATLRPTYRGSADDAARVGQLVHNPEMLANYPPRGARGGRDPYHYLIITGTELAACDGEFNLQALAAEKESRGITTRIETVENIRAAYPGDDDAEKVRNFIRDMYQQNDATYVLLAGDADLEVVGGETEEVIVPARGLWGDVEYGGPDLNIPSDLYFACLDGDFDADLDGVYGEETDAPDLMAEVLVGRAPADSCAEIEHFVQKTLAYRAEHTERLRNVWLAGEWLGPDSYAAPMLEALRTGSWQGGTLLHGFVENPFFAIHTLYDAGVCEKDCWGPEEIMDVMNGGVHILHHCGHSYTNYNMRVTCDDIDAGLSNQEYFFQYTGGCYPGSFDNRLDPLGGNNAVSEQDSFAEHLVMGPHGAFAAIMFSRYGVGDLLPRLFWDGAFGQGLKELGALHTESRQRATAWVDDPYVRWQIYSLNLFGDPEVALHMSDSDEPVLGVQTSPLVFAAIEGSEAPGPQTLLVRNDGGGALVWTVSANQDWLTVTPLSGTAPAEIEIRADPTGLGAGQYQGQLTLEAPNAQGSPATVDVWLIVAAPARVEAPHTPVPPVVDGEVDAEEYQDAGFLDVGLVAAGLSSAYLQHDNHRFYLALVIGDDHDADGYDAVNLYFDADNDDAWPTEPGTDGVYGLYGDGTVYFVPMYDPGNGVQYGDYELDPAGVEIAFGLQAGARILEISFDLEESSLQLEPGGSFGLTILQWDHGGGDVYTPVAVWPAVVYSVGLDDCAFYGDVELGREADRLFVSPDELVFAGVAGGEAAGPIELVIETTTEAELDLVLQASVPWIELAAETGTTPASVQIRADPAGLESGGYEGNVTVIAPEAKNSPVEIPVFFDVAEAPPVFGLDPVSLSYELTEGDPAPADTTLTVDNLGGGALAWTAVATCTWLSLSDTSGTAPSTVTVSADPAGFSAGNHDCALIFTAPGADPAVVSASLILASDEDPQECEECEECDPCDCPDQSSGCATTTGTTLTPLLLLLLLLLPAGHRIRRAR